MKDAPRDDFAVFAKKEEPKPQLTAEDIMKKLSGGDTDGPCDKLPTMEPFGQRFVGIVDTYPLLSVAVVEQAAKDFEVYTRNNDVVLEFKGLPGGMGFYQELPPEYAYALFIRLQRILFGSNPDAGFGSKP